jgi:hypothetical protein
VELCFTGFASVRASQAGMPGRRPTDSCQLRRWRACEAAELAAGDRRQQTAAIAPWIAGSLWVERTRWRNASARPCQEIAAV